MIPDMKQPRSWGRPGLDQLEPFAHHGKECFQLTQELEPLEPPTRRWRLAVSETALAWARSKPAKSIAQKDVLLAMAEAADEDGTVQASVRALTPLIGGMTQAQVQKYADGLVQAGWATKGWDADKYVWKYRLNVVPV